MMVFSNRTKLILTLLAFSLGLCVIISLSVGYAKASIWDFVDLLTGHSSKGMTFIIKNIRLPRVLVCLLGGGFLALSGLLLQNITKNPLADSGILGINAGAGLVLALFIAYAQTADTKLIALRPILAVIGGTMTTTLVYWISRKKNHGINPTRLIITGIGLSSLLSGLMITIVSQIDAFKVPFIVSWLNGSIAGGTWANVLWFSPLISLLWLITYAQGQSLNILNLNEQTALALGLNLQKQRLVVLILSTALAALSVILIGNITFIGLIAGHISRRLLGVDHRLTIPSSLMIGMMLLLLADTLGRVLLVGTGIPTGIIVTMIGAPYFLYLMTKVR